MGPAPLLWLEPLEPPGSLQRLAAIEALLPAMERRWGLALPPRRRWQYWCSRAALRRRLAPLLGCGPLELPLHAPPGQPPRLPAGAGWVSLSHSGAGLLIGYAPQPIGVDLEWAARPLRPRALLARFFPPQEARQLEGLDGPRLREAVLRSWVLKEAAIKWRRRSLAAELGSWLFDHEQGVLLHRGDGARPDWHAGSSGPWRWAAVATDLAGLVLQQQWRRDDGVAG